MKEKSRGSTFAVSFFAALFLFSVPYGAALISNEGRKNESDSSSEFVQTADAITLLAACADENEMPDEMLIMSFSPHKKQVSYTVLPGETGVFRDGAYTTLAKVWCDDGGRDASDAVFEVTGAKIDRFLLLRADSLVSLINRVGTIDYTPSDGSENAYSYRSILNAEEMRKLVKNEEGETRRRLISSLVGEVLSQRAALLRPSDIEKIYLIAVNAGENDLTAEDYETRRNALNELFSSDFTVAHVVAGGEYDEENNTFELSASSRSAMKLAFAK